MIEQDRAELRCFHCDSKRAEVFARPYLAKFGEHPPMPIEYSLGYKGEYFRGWS